MTEKREMEMLPRRKAFSFLGLAALSLAAAPTLLMTSEDAEAQATTTQTPQTGTQRHQERRAQRQERRRERRWIAARQRAPAVRIRRQGLLASDQLGNGTGPGTRHFPGPHH